MTTELLTPAEMADLVGVSVDTLRYYERERLISGVGRADNGHRRYDADDVAWIRVLRCLRDTGMTIDQLRHYCDLGEQGVTTKPERLAMLRDHRAKVELWPARPIRFRGANGAGTTRRSTQPAW